MKTVASKPHHRSLRRVRRYVNITLTLGEAKTLQTILDRQSAQDPAVKKVLEYLKAKVLISTRDGYCD
jgi:hypothetical protein